MMLSMSMSKMVKHRLIVVLFDLYDCLLFEVQDHVVIEQVVVVDSVVSV